MAVTNPSQVVRRGNVGTAVPGYQVLVRRSTQLQLQTVVVGDEELRGCCRCAAPDSRFR